MKNFLAQREFTPNFLIRPKNFFEHRVPRPQIVHGSDMTKGRTVTKLALTAAMTAAILSSGLAMSANAQENHYMSGQQVIGEKGARIGNQCWVETWGSGSSYFGYWTACEQPKVSKR